MNTQDFKRKLTAVFSADVAGYSRLMGADEAATVKTLESYKQIMFSLIKQHRGRVIDSPGDNLLAEFASVVDAVQCGVAIQKELQARNAEISENRRMQFRIGINLGDVIEEQDRIYGDGVNIAARLESCADPGGICVSKTAFDHIESKLPLGYEFLGEQQVKNIAKPVGAYRVLMEPRVTVAGKKEKRSSIPFRQKKTALAGAVTVLILIIVAVVWNFFFRAPAIEPASKDKMAYPLPDKPSIAVLPFTSIGGGKELEYFSDGLAEGVINGLSKSDRIFVIARNSTFTYKGKPVNVKQVAEEMGVQYVIEGSVQQAENRVRITAQLIDALSGRHLFSERYDRDLKDILNLQDEITLKVLTAVQVKLTRGEVALLSEKGTKNLDAYLKVLQAVEYKGGTLNKERVERAIQLLEEAIALDPGYPIASSTLCTAHFDLVAIGASESPRESLQRAVELGKKAVALDESNSSVHASLAFPYVYLREFDKAISEAEKAVSLSPNSALAYFALGFAFWGSNRPQEAISMLQKSLRLSPIPYHSQVLGALGGSYLRVGQFEEAIATYKKMLQIYGPDHLMAHVSLALTYAFMGRESEARAEHAEVFRIDPKFSWERWLKSYPLDQSVKDRIAELLRKTGLYDKPSLPLPDKPSIAVLPFVNMSDDKSQEFFSDGLTEEIISALSRVSGLFVIARNSSFTYKGKSVWVPDVARDLGVQHIMEGSVRRSGDRIRITAQLIDGKTNNHTWSETYDRELKDIFAVQDEITMKILTKVKVKLTGGEDSIAPLAKRATNLQAYLKILEASAYMDESRFSEARRLYEEALSLDPKSPAYSGLAMSYLMDVFFGPPATRAQALGKAIEYGEKCIEQDETNESCHRNLCYAYPLKRGYEKALHHGRKAIELNPNSAMAASFLSFALRSVGEYEEAVRQCERAIRLDPRNYMPLYQIGATYVMMKRHNEAIEALSKAIKMNPKHMPSWVVLVMGYSSLDRMEEARAAAAEVLKLSPNFSVENFVKALPYKDEEPRQFMADALHKGGLK